MKILLSVVLLVLFVVSSEALPRNRLFRSLTSDVNESKGHVRNRRQVSACAAVTCQNGGTCQPLMGSNYVCQCYLGYYGAHCESSLPGAAPAPAPSPAVYPVVCYEGRCQHGGSCLPMGSSYTCYCMDGFTGQDCQIPLAEATTTATPSQGPGQVQTCGGAITLTPGQTSSISHSYSNYDNCTWNVNIAPGYQNTHVVQAGISEADIEQHATCGWDGLYLNDTDGSPLATICGMCTGGLVTSSGPTMVVRFLADMTVVSHTGRAEGVPHITISFRAVQAGIRVGGQMMNQPECVVMEMGELPVTMTTTAMPLPQGPEPCDFYYDCGNAGSCFVNATGAPYCYCMDGTVGSNCTAIVSPPTGGSQGLCNVNNPCQNGGSCFINSTGSYCICADGSQRNNCTGPGNPPPNNGPLDPCDHYPLCGSAGSCFQNAAGSPYCICMDGTVGSSCSGLGTPPTGPCNHYPLCGSAGSCFQNAAGSPYCICMDGTVGSSCSGLGTPPTGPCNHYPLCGNAGSCFVNSSGAPYCICMDGTTGSNCSGLGTPPTQTTPTYGPAEPCDYYYDCGNAGSCFVNATGSPFCICMDGTTGSNCSGLYTQPTQVPPANGFQATCGSQVHTVEPGSPVTLRHSYHNNEDCVYNVSVPTGRQDLAVSVQVEQINIETNTFCSYDFLSLSDPAVQTNNVKLCGSCSEGSFRATQGRVNVHFHSDYTVIGNTHNSVGEFRVTVITVPRTTGSVFPASSYGGCVARTGGASLTPPSTTTSLPPAPVLPPGCPTGPQQISLPAPRNIRSCGYPNDYPNNMYQVWNITAPGADRCIVARVSGPQGFHTEAGYDLVTFVDLPSMTQTRRHGTYSPQTVLFVSLGNTMRVVMTSDMTITKTGFNLRMTPVLCSQRQAYLAQMAPNATMMTTTATPLPTTSPTTRAPPVVIQVNLDQVGDTYRMSYPQPSTGAVRRKRQAPTTTTPSPSTTSSIPGWFSPWWTSSTPSSGQTSPPAPGPTTSYPAWFNPWGTSPTPSPGPTTSLPGWLNPSWSTTPAPGASGETYDDNADVTWIFRSTNNLAGKGFVVAVDDGFHTEEAFDFLHINNSNTMVTKIHGIYPSGFPLAKVTDDVMILRFTSDDSVTHAGFNVTVTLVDAVSTDLCDSNPCLNGGECTIRDDMMSGSGSGDSPYPWDYPGNYPNSGDYPYPGDFPSSGDNPPVNQYGIPQGSPAGNPPALFGNNPGLPPPPPQPYSGDTPMPPYPSYPGPFPTSRPYPGGPSCGPFGSQVCCLCPISNGFPYAKNCATFGLGNFPQY